MSDPTGERYWHFFCEENIWHRCGALPENAREAHAVFISNAARSVRMAHQRAGIPPDFVVHWDYHVVLMLRLQQEREARAPWWVIDPDTTLPCPTPVALYLDQSFPEPSSAEPPDARTSSTAPRFRLIPAQQYRLELCSDRRHMLDASGRWRVSLPPWPPIGHGHNLDRFIAMDAGGPGKVVTLPDLHAWLGLV